MKQYDEYKDSGIEWVGEIPAHWEVVKLKYLTDIGNGKDHKGVWEPTGAFPIIGTGGEFGRSSEYLYSSPSVILGRKGTIDKPIFINQPFWAVDTAYYTIPKRGTDVKYLYYLCKTINFDFYRYGSAVPSMNQEDLKEIFFAVPSTKPEQTAIANYLDRKTAELDQLITDQKALVELYKEEKNAIINHAVTKGIDPDVTMKDSGVEWLGEVPERWKVSSMKYTCEFINDGTHGSYPRVSDGYRLLSVRNIINSEFVFREDDSKVSEEHFKEISRKFSIRSGDVQLAIVGATLGKVAIVGELAEPFVTQRSVATFRVNEKCSPKYLFYFIKASKFQSYLWLNAGFSAQPGVYLGTLQNASILLPSINDQQLIVHRIESEFERLDTKITKATTHIDLLTEYRTALISEVVTGKVRVTEEV